MSNDVTDAAPPKDSPKDNQQPQKRRFGCGTVLLTLFGILCVTGLILFWLVRSEPVHWQQRKEFLASHSEEELLVIAETVEQRLLASLNGSTGEGTRRGAGNPSRATDSTADEGRTDGSDSPTKPAKTEVALTINEVNAWMNQRLDGWLQYQGKQMPPGVRQPMLSVDGERLVLAFRYQQGRMDQIVSLKFKLELREGTEATIRLDKIQAGRLPLPGGMMKKQLTKMGGTGDSGEDRVKKLAEAFDGMTFDPVLELDNRAVRLVGAKMQPNGVVLTVQPDH